MNLRKSAALTFSLSVLVSGLSMGCGDDTAGGTGGTGNTGTGGTGNSGAGGTGNTGTGGTGNSGAGGTGNMGGTGGSGGSVDMTAPGPVTDLQAAVNAGTGEIDLTWTNPGDADLAGILVVNGEGVVVDFMPVDGTGYALNDPAGTGQLVLNTATATAVSQTAPIIGLPYDFSVWAFDDSMNYSAAATVMATKNALGTQTGSITVSLANQTVTVNTQPANLTLAGTVVYDDPGDTITVSLDATNDTGRLLFNLKSLTDNLNQGTQGGPVFPPNAAGLPYAYYGPEALDVGANAVRDLVITGVDGAMDPITFDVTFVDAPMLFGANYGSDFGGVDTSGSGETWDADPVNGDGTGAQLRQGLSTRDGRFLYAGEKRTPWVNIVDTTTYLFTAGADLSSAGLGSCGGMALSPSGANLYVAFNDGADYHGGDQNGDSSGNPNATTTSVVLYDLDATTLVTNQSLTLVDMDVDGSTAYEMAVSPDGSMAAVAVSHIGNAVNHLWLIDLATFTVIDTDAVAAGTQPVTLSSVGFAEHVTFGETGASVYVGFNDSKYIGVGGPVVIDVVDTAAYTVAQITPTTGGAKARGLVQMNSKLYYGDDIEELLVFDLANANAETILNLGLTASTGVIFDATHNWIYAIDYNDVAVLDAATDLQVDTDQDAGNGVQNLSSFDQMRAHFHAVSPF